MELERKRRCNWFVYQKCGSDPASNLKYQHLHQTIVYRRGAAFCLHGLMDDAYLDGRKPRWCGTVGKKKAFFTVAHR